jgi:hypothetical protein
MTGQQAHKGFREYLAGCAMPSPLAEQSGLLKMW